MKHYSLTRVKLTALYKQLMTKTTLAYISHKTASERKAHTRTHTKKANLNNNKQL